MTAIVQEGDPALRKVAAEVPLGEIESAAIKKVIADMRRTLSSAKDGVGLAAPQIGVPLRIFIVSEKMFEPDFAEEQTRWENAPETGHLVFINPVLARVSKKLVTMEEGCLSTRHRFGIIERAAKATVTAYDETGKKFTRSASGLLAEIFQHEIDHLNGILFVDKARDVREVKPEHRHAKS